MPIYPYRYTISKSFISFLVLFRLFCRCLLLYSHSFYHYYYYYYCFNHLALSSFFVTLNLNTYINNNNNGRTATAAAEKKNTSITIDAGINNIISKHRWYTNSECARVCLSNSWKWFHYNLIMFYCIECVCVCVRAHAFNAAVLVSESINETKSLLILHFFVLSYLSLH